MSRNTGKTCLNQVAEGFKKVEYWPGDFNFDFGGGKYQKATNWLWKERSIHNFVYDKYNRTERENNLALRMLPMCESLTCFNVLNVMETKEERYEVYSMVKRMNGFQSHAFFTIYAGDGSGEGRVTTKGWQNNQKISFYKEEIENVFRIGYEVMSKRGLIVVMQNDKKIRGKNRQIQRLYGGI